MYLAHFGLGEAPFSITPDPRFLYLSERHRDALAHLLYGVGEGGGFVQLTGEVGTGKTTLCRRFLETIPSHVDVALILNPRLTGPELLAAICDDLSVAYPAGASVKLLVDALYRHLLDAHARGRRTVLVIDEAQDLAPEVLEDVRLLTNLETPQDKLLQIILIGQPELVRLLDRGDLRQVAQRITARYHLVPFTERETCAYIQHRLEVAGVKRPVFDEPALRAVHRLSGGVPRLINTICDRALLGAYAEDRHHVDRAVVRRAAGEALTGPGRPRRAWPWQWLSRGAAGLAVATAAGAWLSASGLDLPRLVARSAARLAGPAVGAAQPGPTLTARLDSDPIRPTEVSPDGRISRAPTATSLAPMANRAAPDRVDSGGIDQGQAAALKGFRTLDELLADPSVAADRDSAFKALYACWGVRYDSSPGLDGCDRGRSAGLRCLTTSGDWDRLRRFDVPAILELAPAGGGRRHAALVSLSEDRATLSFGDRRVIRPRSEIESRWHGAMVLVWRQPALTGVLGRGARGRDVLWLRKRLDEVIGPAGSGGPGSHDVYDEDLANRVAAFQRTRSLEADGIAGEETLVRLAGARPGPMTPWLDGDAPGPEPAPGPARPAAPRG